MGGVLEAKKNWFNPFCYKGGRAFCGSAGSKNIGFKPFFEKGGRALGECWKQKEFGSTLLAMKEGGDSEGVLEAEELGSNLF